MRESLIRAVRRSRVALPGVRVLWICLVVLALYGLNFLGNGLGVASVLALPTTAVVVDLIFQRLRFEKLRAPDSAVATGLFLALIFPPAVPLAGAVAATIAAITVKHTLRYRGRPWLNPAAAGVVIGAVLFGFAPAWWGAISETLVVSVGLVLLLWNWRSWRLPAVFLVAYAFLAVLQRVLVAQIAGGALVPKVLFLATLDPAVLFFALFMVTEPRTAPSATRSQPLHAVVVAAGSALLPIILPTLAVLVSLFAGNTVAVVLRRRKSPERAPGSWRRGRRASRASPGRSSTEPWPLPRRAAVGFVVLLFVAWIAAITYSPLSTRSPILVTSPGGNGAPGAGGSGVTASVCQKDNATIGSSTLASLHRALGPSVILSYDPSTGAVVFYDPVNLVTVTETDLYEDFGYAEFNGDDYTSAGCVP